MDDNDPPRFNDAAAEISYYKSLSRDLQDMLDETRATMDDLQSSSKELEEEMERDLANTEKAHRQLQATNDKLRSELDDWKVKFQHTLREHTVTLSHMQKELESTRASENLSRTKLRDMELDNDDLEKSERAMSSTLQDMEIRYGKAIERTALLEEELVAKARLEEECQRLKDELRDLNEEISVLREQRETLPPPTSRPITPPGGAQEVSEARFANDTNNNNDNDEDKEKPTPNPNDPDQTPTRIHHVTQRKPRHTLQKSPSLSASSSNSNTRIPSPVINRQNNSSIPSPIRSGTPNTNANMHPTTPSIRNNVKPVKRYQQSSSATSARSAIDEVKTIAERVQSLRARLDARRQNSTIAMAAAAGSSIPRPRTSMSSYNYGTPPPRPDLTGNSSSSITNSAMNDRLSRRRSGRYSTMFGTAGRQTPINSHHQDVLPESSTVDSSRYYDRSESPSLIASRAMSPPMRPSNSTRPLSRLSLISMAKSTTTTTLSHHQASSSYSSRPRSSIGFTTTNTNRPPSTLPIRSPTPNSNTSFSSSSQIPRRRQSMTPRESSTSPIPPPPPVPKKK